MWLELGDDLWVFDLLVIDEQKRLAQDDAEHTVAFKGKVEFVSAFGAAGWHNAEILVVGQHQNVATAQVDL
ncbi:MAG: hypothetical protein R3E58_11495 [Phycisphaerae bacterium]